MLADFTLLRLNDIAFQANPGEIEDYAVKIATEHVDVKEISNWLTAHLTKADN